VEASGEGFVDITAEIRRQNDRPVVLFKLLKEIGDFNIGVAVVRVFHFAPLTEEGIGFVEEEYALASAGGGEDAIEIFFCLADVLADDAGQIDAKDVEPQVIADNAGSHGLARARSAGEQGFQTFDSRVSLAEAPSVIDGVAMAYRFGEFADLPQGRCGEHEIVPRLARYQAASEATDRALGLIADRDGEIGEIGRPRLVGEREHVSRIGSRRRNAARAERVAGGKLRCRCAGSMSIPELNAPLISRLAEADDADLMSRDHPTPMGIAREHDPDGRRRIRNLVKEPPGFLCAEQVRGDKKADSTAFESLKELDARWLVRGREIQGE